ncbi:hypothetical protein K0U83_21515 [bacterium]|nr:hypothetical protein [bacterium]
MNATLASAIATGLASLTRVVDAPVAPFGFGSDLSCSSDLSATCAELDGDDPQVVIEAIARSLQCPTGGLVDDKSYGFDLVGMLNRGVTTHLIREVGGRVKAMTLTDDRVDSCAVKVTPSSDGKTLTVEIRGVLADQNKTAFSLVLACTSSEILINEMRAAA